jgi:hypothetical protein
MLLKPSKYTDPQTSILAVVAVIMQVLNGVKRLRFVELHERVVSRLGDDAKENFMPALSFLFVVGRISYAEEADYFEYYDNK